MRVEVFTAGQPHDGDDAAAPGGGPHAGLDLEALPQIKRERRIFFTLAWLNAFIGGQSSRAALDIVSAHLATGKVEPDHRLKILEVADELERAVRIRAATSR